MKRMKQQAGFTIVELMIATAVFSVVLLLCTYGLLEIGRTYYKGVTSTRTQETARIILDDAAEAIQFNSGNVEPHAGAGWHCVGTKRYSFAIGRQLTDTNHALVSDTVPSCGGGTGRQGQVDGGNLSPSSRELLNTRTRLANFDIQDLGDNLYRITVRVISGEDDLLLDTDSDGVLDSCRNERAGSQFCAVSELTTVARKRV